MIFPQTEFISELQECVRPTTILEVVNVNTVKLQMTIVAMLMETKYASLVNTNQTQDVIIL